MVALDTGFFVALMRGSGEAKSLWRGFKENKITPFVSVLTVGELSYILHREGKSNEADMIIKRMEAVTRIVDVDASIARKAAEIKHFKHIPYIDSLVGATAILTGCEKLCTSDRKHMKSLQAYGVEIVFVHE